MNEGEGFFFYVALHSRAAVNASSETQGQLVGAGKSLNGRGKKSGEEKSRTKIGSLPVIGHKKYFWSFFGFMVLVSMALFDRGNSPARASK